MGVNVSLDTKQLLELSTSGIWCVKDELGQRILITLTADIGKSISLVIGQIKRNKHIINPDEFKSSLVEVLELSGDISIAKYGVGYWIDLYTQKGYSIWGSSRAPVRYKLVQKIEVAHNRFVQSVRCNNTRGDSELLGYFEKASDASAFIEALSEANEQGVMRIHPAYAWNDRTKRRYMRMMELVTDV